MTKRKPKSVKEPVQVYLESPEKLLLDRLAKSTNLSRAEVLRRGLRSFGAEVFAKTNPMVSLIREIEASYQPAGDATDIAEHHDRYLAEEYLESHEPRKARKR